MQVVVGDARRVEDVPGQARRHGVVPLAQLGKAELAAAVGRGALRFRAAQGDRHAAQGLPLLVANRAAQRVGPRLGEPEVVICERRARLVATGCQITGARHLFGLVVAVTHRVVLIG